MKEEVLKFPNNFFWGAATSSHQVEGHNKNNWTKWEKENAHKLLVRSFSSYSKWLPAWNWVKKEASSLKNYVSDRTCDQYNLFEKDFDIAKDLGLNAYRFSIEWSKIEPKEGVFNEKAIEHYQKMVKELIGRGITPFVTIWHWTFPLWVSNKKGFLDRYNQEYFERYVRKIVESLPEVKYWMTFNEPEVYAGQSYLQGQWPPEKKNILSYYRVINNIIKIHRSCYDIIHSINKDALVSIVKNNTWFYAYKNKWHNKIAASVLSYLNNRDILERVKDKLDFVSVNYYLCNEVGIFKEKKVKYPLSDLGWEICPEGIYSVLLELKRYKKPIFITENGIADAKDQYRGKYIRHILYYVHKAIMDGADVRGYMHWSLLDNFEWDKGFWPKFGLVEVNFKTQDRMIRKSALEYSEIVKKNGFQLKIPSLPKFSQIQSQ